MGILILYIFCIACLVCPPLSIILIPLGFWLLKSSDKWKRNKEEIRCNKAFEDMKKKNEEKTNRWIVEMRESTKRTQAITDRIKGSSSLKKKRNLKEEKKRILAYNRAFDNSQKSVKSSTKKLNGK